MANYYLLLGSNQGNREQNLEKATQLIQEQLGKPVSSSSIYETEAWGLEDQPDFLNQALHVISDVKPDDFLQTIKSIEKKLGRSETIHWGPRVIDIDILYIDDQIIQQPDLKIPHHGIYDRNFVLIPMIEIAGELTDPVKNITLDEIYDSCTDTKEVYIYDGTES